MLNSQPGYWEAHIQKRKLMQDHRATVFRAFLVTQCTTLEYEPEKLRRGDLGDNKASSVNIQLLYQGVRTKDTADVWQKTCLFLAACRDSFLLAELCPSYPLWRGSRYFCEVTSPEKEHKKMLMNIGKFIWQKIQRGPVALYIDRQNTSFIPEANKRDDWYMVFENPCYKWSSYSWGIMFAQRQLEAFEKIWQRQPVHSVHLWPSLCLSNWGCNLSCNPSHFCLCLCCWDSHLGTTKLKFTFLYKRRTWIVVNLRAIPIHVAPGPSPIQREHE